MNDSAKQPIDYMSPDVPGELPWVNLPVVTATDENLQGFGCLVSDYQNFDIEIVQWPAQGWRPVDAGTGDEGGTTIGNFYSWWQGDYLYGRNDAVSGEYVLGWSQNPKIASNNHNEIPQRVLLWHCNYHPDGGQLFFPLDGKPFVVPLARAGDDITPQDFVAFYFDGSKGLYIHPSIWHDGVFPIQGSGNFYDEQGKVHARVSVNFAKEFGVFLNVPLIG